MSTMHAQPAILPVLRPDIEFHPGPDDPNGSPTYVIHDPLRGTFEKATWVQAQILRLLRVPLTVDRLLKQLSTYTTIRVTGQDVKQLCADASRKGLTMDARVADMRVCQAQQTRAKANRPQVLLRKLFYLRIPLVKPDAFLGRTVHLVRHLAGPVAMPVFLFISMIGVILLAQRFDAYLSTFPYFFNLRGTICFTLAIAVVKTVHELSHAYVAKALGNRVPTMGVALIFLFPVAYSDVTDCWRMRSRRKRLLISLAGVMAELVIAGIALFVWAMSPAGLLKSVCFVVSSATLISTLLVNLNPAVRFDGYYVLSDLLGIDNLQSRSFAATRWVLRRHLLGMNVEAPEVGLPQRRLAVMVAYSVFAWIYRLFLYSGIALMLYHWVTKVIGGILFATAIYSFIVKPVVTEAVSVMKMRKRFGWNPRMVVVGILCGLVLLWVSLPLPRWQAVPATTVPQDSQMIYTPGDGVIHQLGIGLGSTVRKGQALFVIDSNELESQARLALLEMQRIGIELAVIKSDDKRRALLPQKTKEMGRATAALESIRAAIARDRIVAEVDGTIVEWDESVCNGTPVGVNRVLGKIVDHRAPVVACYVRHDLVSDVAVNDRVYFTSNATPGRISGMVTNVDPVRTAFLEHRGLASISGGDIAVTVDAQGRLEVIDSYYEVEVMLDHPANALRLGQTGRVWLRSAPRSRLVDLVGYIYRVLIRESSF